MQQQQLPDGRIQRLVSDARVTDLLRALWRDLRPGSHRLDSVSSAINTGRNQL